MFNASQKGLPPTPTLSVRPYLTRFGLVVFVDEFRTSNRCSVCGCTIIPTPGRTTIAKAARSLRARHIISIVLM